MDARKRLFAMPPAEFTHARDALARELRDAGKAEEAREVKALHKPTVALWIANQLSRLAPADVTALIHATGRLRKGDDLREAMREQRDALAKLADAAGRAAVEAGTKLTLELQRRVQNTVQAAATGAAEALREGVLEREMEPVGFEGLAGVPLGKKAKGPEKDETDKEKEREKELKKAEHEAQRLEEHARKLEEAAEAAREKADAARAEADAAARRALELRRA